MSSMASTAVLPALSRTPGRYPIQTIQSNASGKGSNEEICVTGLVKISVRTVSSCAGVKSASIVITATVRTRSTAIPK